MQTRSIVLAVTLGAASACISDPTHNASVDALGHDPTGHGNGPLHRAGQPCLVCHGGMGPGTDFTVAGTVFRSKTVITGVEGVKVLLIDARDRSFVAVTNQVGNFYLTSNDFDPVYPVRTSVSYTGASGKSVTTPMVTHIGREGACGACHQDPESTSQAGHVYVVGFDGNFPR